MPVASFVVLLILGVLFMLMGLFIYRDEKIDYIHSYHHKNVSEEDKGRFCRFIGTGLGTIGVGVTAYGCVGFFAKVEWAWAFMVVGFVIGLYIIIHATKKFNGKIFS